MFDLWAVFSQYPSSPIWMTLFLSFWGFFFNGQCISLFSFLFWLTGAKSGDEKIFKKDIWVSLCCLLTSYIFYQQQLWQMRQFKQVREVRPIWQVRQVRQVRQVGKVREVIQRSETSKTCCSFRLNRLLKCLSKNVRKIDFYQ